jgi:hypothetical protein
MTTAYIFITRTNLLFKFFNVQILIVRVEKIIYVLYNFFKIKLKIKLIHFFLYKLTFFQKLFI